MNEWIELALVVCVCVTLIFWAMLGVCAVAILRSIATRLPHLFDEGDDDEEDEGDDPEPDNDSELWLARVSPD